jgi:hypothetical protein
LAAHGAEGPLARAFDVDLSCVALRQPGGRCEEVVAVRRREDVVARPAAYASVVDRDDELLAAGWGIAGRMTHAP